MTLCVTASRSANFGCWSVSLNSSSSGQGGLVLSEPATLIVALRLAFATELKSRFVLAGANVTFSTPAAVIQFEAISNQTFSVLYRTNLNESVWLKLVDVPSRATNRVVQVRETNSAPDLRLYRLIAPAQP